LQRQKQQFYRTIKPERENKIYNNKNSNFTGRSKRSAKTRFAAANCSNFTGRLKRSAKTRFATANCSNFTGRSNRSVKTRFTITKTAILPNVQTGSGQSRISKKQL